MITEQILTLNDPAGLLITPEILQLIGIEQGDKVEIIITDRKLVLRSLDDAEKEAKMDEAMKSLMERRSGLYERLAEGAK
jgi:bifunctional DNA-binding transcriptional regulator/antitoxin component of YhaV-PrlF toxin-antitoxin module